MRTEHLRTLLLCLSIGATLIFYARPIVAQDIIWQRTYGSAQDEVCFDVEPLPDGGFLLAGYRTMVSYYPWLVRTDADGDTLWTRTFGPGGTTAWFRDIEPAADGGFLLVGRLDDGGLIIKIGADGDSLWSATDPYGVTMPFYRARRTSNDGFMVVGSNGYGGKMIRIDSDGGFDWSNNLDPGYAWQQWVFDFALVSDVPDSEEFVFAGTAWWDNEDWDLVVAKEHSAYGGLWTDWFSRYGGPDSNVGQALLLEDNSELTVAGYRDAQSGEGSAWLMRLDENGDSLWSREYYPAWAPLETVGAFRMCRGQDSGYVLVGGGDNGIYVVDAAPDGDTLWTTEGGTAYGDVLNAVARTQDGNYVVAGYTQSMGAGGYDFYLALVGPLPYVGGDADGNGIVNVSDAVYLIGYIFGGGEAPDPLLSGDADCNEIVNIADAVYLIAYIFGGGPEPGAGCK
jgi:hypothetical protein